MLPGGARDSALAFLWVAVIRSLSMLKLGRFQPPVRRVLAVDAGSRSLRLLLAESRLGRMRVLREEYIDLQSEGLVSADENKAQLQAFLEDWGRPPLGLVLPQHFSTSQVIDLPVTPEQEVEKLIQAETLKLGGVTDSRIVYDFVRLESPSKTRQSFWVTICQESDIRERIARLGVEGEDISEVTTTANALISAYCSAAPDSRRAILVHLGAQTTVLAIVQGGQGAFATSFQMGGDFITRSLARLTLATEEQAETIKRERNLLSGPDRLPAFVEVVDGWVAELKRQLNEWFALNAEMAAEVGTFKIVGSGGGFEQPGLIEYLRDEAGLNVENWPAPARSNCLLPGRGFEVACGTALQALGQSSQPVSLVPEDYQQAWKKRLAQQRLELASFVLVLVCILLFAAGTWHKLNLIERKSTLLDRTIAAQEARDTQVAFQSELVSGYETMRPVFIAEQNTIDSLKALAALQNSRSNRSFWYVLIADQQSYFNPPPSMLPTNRPARTNLAAVVPAPADRPYSYGFIGPVLTNTAPSKPGLIAELTVPGGAEAARVLLSQVVNELNQQPVFSRVDSLSDDLRRNVAEPRVIVADRHFAIALDYAETNFLQHLPAPGRKRTGQAGSRPPRAALSSSENGRAGKGGV